MGHQRATQIRTAEATSHKSAGTSTKPLLPTRTPVHSILQLQQTIGNQAVKRLIQAKLKIDRPGDKYDHEAGRAADQVMRMPARAGAEMELRRRWRIGKVYEGTMADQVIRLQFFRMFYFGSADIRWDIQNMLKKAGWRAWSPPSGSPLWKWLIEAFENFERVFGGVPQVQEIAFYETDYTFLPPSLGGSALQQNPDVAADYGGGRMAIYHTAETRAKEGSAFTQAVCIY